MELTLVHFTSQNATQHPIPKVDKWVQTPETGIPELRRWAAREYGLGDREITHVRLEWYYIGFTPGGRSHGRLLQELFDNNVLPSVQLNHQHPHSRGYVSVSIVPCDDPTHCPRLESPESQNPLRKRAASF